MELQNKFDTIYQSHYAKVYRLCKGYFQGDDAIAQDATQEAFIKVWENLSTFRNEANIGTWVYKIAANTCLMYLRKQQHRSFICAEIILEKPEEIEDNEDKFRKMYDCINQLSPSNKLIIMMVLEGISYEEVADIIGLSEETLRVRIHRIKDKLSKCVQNG